MKSWLDKHPMLQHLVIGLAATAVAWLGSDVLPWLKAQDGVWPVFAAPVLVTLLAWLSPWVTKTYGLRGSTGGAVVRADRVTVR